MGKRPVLTPDEVLRLPIDEALVIIRGKKTLKVDKMDYSKHPEYPLLRSCKASAHVPEWRRMEMEAGEKKAGTQRAGAQKAEIQGAGVQKRAEAQKSRLQGAGTKTAGMQGAKDNAGIKKEMAQKTWAQKAEDAQDASGDRATAETRNAGKEEAAKASPKAASKTEPKAPAGNAKQTAGRRASGNGATGRT